MVLNTQRKKAKMNLAINIKCPYCGSGVRLVDGEVISYNKRYEKYYVCNRYPSCDSYVSTHPGTIIPTGIPANRHLRSLRREAHMAFDQLWKTKNMSRTSAYAWLADTLGLDKRTCHIGNFLEGYCILTINECKRINGTERSIKSDN